MNGLVLIDKPSGPTSHDIVNQWRKMAGTRRVGHLGTLDPMATGLLALVSGLATRLAPYFSTDEKSYDAEITFGFTSDTYDAEGSVQPTNQPLPSAAQIASSLERFKGAFLQTPPPVSAKKIHGVAAYKLVRQQVDFELKPVEVRVHDLHWTVLEPARIRLSLTCSAGTYIRGIAHDLGKTLGCGAILTALRRTAVAGILVSTARTPAQLLELHKTGRIADAVIPMGELLPHYPAAYVSEEVERAIRQGRDFRTSPFAVQFGAPLVRALSRSGDLIAIGEIRFPNSYHPATVF